MTRKYSSLVLFLAFTCWKGLAEPAALPALHDATILVIRHAERPANGQELNDAGKARAQAYVGYFEHLKLDGVPVKLDYLAAAADSEGSHRCHMTIEPLAEALHLPVHLKYKNKELDKLAEELRTTDHGRTLLICWHHGHIPELLDALGADSGELLHHAKWPKEVFNWMVVLHYDSQGHLDASRCTVVNENLMPGDDAHEPPTNKTVLTATH